MSLVPTAFNPSIPLQQDTIGAGELPPGRKRTRPESSPKGASGSRPFNSSKSVPKTRPKKRRRRAAVVVSNLDAEPSEADNQWTDRPEKEVAYGPRPDHLARLITRPCHPSDEEYTGDNHYFRCIYSTHCHWAQKSIDRQLNRIYRHAARCSALQRWKPDLYDEAGVALANMAPGGHQSISSVKGEDLVESVSSPSSAATSITHPEPVFNAPDDPFLTFNQTRNMSRHERIDHAIAKLICNSGSPLKLVDEAAWGELLVALEAPPDYSSPTSSYLRDKLIPAEAKRALLLMKEHLANQSNISLSFDGLSAGEQPVYTVHTCTANRRSFLYRGDVFYGSHNTDYVVDLLEQVVNEIGSHRISSVVSDDTNTTKKARRILSKRYPSILNLADPVHKINLCIQDICLDPLWTDSLTKTPNPLQAINICNRSIGKTRFATIYYSATSVLVNLPALYKIYRDKEIDTTGTPLPDSVAEVLDEASVPAMDFRKALTQLVNVLEPFARALLCLESIQSTLSDVYFYWLAALAAWNQYFESKQSRLSIQDKARLQSIIYRRFNEAINDAPTDIYVSAFFLDPRYRTSSIFSGLGNFDTGTSQPTLRQAGSTAVRMTQAMYDRVRKQLLTMLRHELEAAEAVPGHLLHQYDALRAKNELIEQLSQYHLGQPPFQQYSSRFDGPVQYWALHHVSRFSFILAYLAEKVFSVLPNSMCDERTGSRLTYLYSKLRTRTDAKTMVEQIQFSQINATVVGKKPVMRHKKPLLRFQDIPEEYLPENSTTDTNGLALSDEAGDEWLDESVAPLPVPDELREPHSLRRALVAHGIDLTSQLLVNALSTMSLDVFSLPLESSVALADSDGTCSTTYVRAADVCWDD